MKRRFFALGTVAAFWGCCFWRVAERRNLTGTGRTPRFSPKLRGLPEGVRAVAWRALNADSETLPVERLSDGVCVSVPEIGAWNAGYIDFSVGRTGGVK